MARPRRISASLDFRHRRTTLPSLEKIPRCRPNRLGDRIERRYRPTLGCRSRLLRGCAEKAQATPHMPAHDPSSEHALSTRRRRGRGRQGAKNRRFRPSTHNVRASQNLRCGAGILAEPVGEIGMARLVVELDGFLKMVMGAGEIAEMKASAAGNAVRDQGLGAIRPGRGFAQEKLGHFAHRCRFAAAQMPAPKTVIGGEPFRGVFLPARQFAGARKGRARFRR